MKPSKVHYFFAEEKPVKLWMRNGQLVGVFLSARACHPTLELFGEWSGSLRFIAVLVLGWLLGHCAACLIGWFVLGPLYFDRSCDNGEPFQQGDLVHILVGPHRDRVVPVRKAWNIGDYAGGHRVSVDLDEVWTDGEEVFPSYQVLLVARGLTPESPATTMAEPARSGSGR
jgi:hypothetical protein